MSDITQLGANGEQLPEAKEQAQAEKPVESTVTESSENSAIAVEQPAENMPAADPESVVKRINKYAARAKSAEELYLQEQQKNMLMQQQMQQFVAQQQAQRQNSPQHDPYAPVPPNKSQFSDRPLDYAESLANYYNAKSQYDAMQHQKQYQEMQLQNTQREVEAQYAQKLRLVKETYDDWDDAYESLTLAATQVPQNKINDLAFTIQALSNGPEVTRYLGLHPDEFIAIANGDSRVAAVKLAEIGAKIKPPAKKLSSSPPPPKQIKGEAGRMSPSEETIEQLARRLARNR